MRILPRRRRHTRPRVHPLMRIYLKPGRKRYPDTHPRNLPKRYKALRRRRAKNKVAKRSRKANR